MAFDTRFARLIGQEKVPLPGRRGLSLPAPSPVMPAKAGIHDFSVMAWIKRWSTCSRLIGGHGNQKVWRTAGIAYKPDTSLICFESVVGAKGMSRLIAVGGLASQLLIFITFTATLPGCVPYMVMSSMDHQHYSDYVVQTEQINTTRQENHLAPDPIMTFAEWKGTSSSVP